MYNFRAQEVEFLYPPLTRIILKDSEQISGKELQALLQEEEGRKRLTGRIRPSSEVEEDPEDSLLKAAKRLAASRAVAVSGQLHTSELTSDSGYLPGETAHHAGLGKKKGMLKPSPPLSAPVAPVTRGASGDGEVRCHMRPSK